MQTDWHLKHLFVFQRKTRRWRATARSLTGGSRWSNALRAASGCTSPVPRWRGPPSQTSGTAPSARRKVQKEEQKLGREQRRGKIRHTASSARRPQVSRRSHNKEDKLPIIDSGSVLLRVVCLPQYKAPVSRALSISIFHIHNLFTDLVESQKLSPELRRLLLSKYFWHTNHLKVVPSHSLLSVYQIINVSRLTSGKSRLKMRLVNIIVQIQTYMNSNVIRFWYLGRIGTVDSYWALMTMLLCSQTVFKTRQQQTFISWRPPWKSSTPPRSQLPLKAKRPTVELIKVSVCQSCHASALPG